MKWLGIGKEIADPIDAIGDAFDKVLTSDDERLQGEAVLMKLRQKPALVQASINKMEAQHRSVFVAGWRPAVGWVCVSVLAFNYIGVYLMEFAVSFMDAAPKVPERFDMSELWPVLLGMLGIGGMRSFDKKNNTQTDSI